MTQIATMAKKLDRVIKTYSSVLVDEIKLSDCDTGFRVPGMARVLAQVHSYRVFSLLNSLQALLKVTELGSAMVIARSLIEALVVLHWDMFKLKQCVESKDVGAIHDYLVGATFRTRDKKLITASGLEVVLAPNILTMLDRFDKSFCCDMRTTYNHISEYVHPNCFGGFLYFVKHDKATEIARFNAQGWLSEEVIEWLSDVTDWAELAIAFVQYLEKLADQIKAIE